MSTEEAPAEQEEMPILASLPINDNHNNAHVVEETDFLGDNVKYRTYVHKRNPKVGSILDIIMLGTFVITAGMALGHLWSCKNECALSFDKIVNDLHKLQSENILLQDKLKEITEATSYQLTQQQKPTNKPNKPSRCKKIFEDPDMKNNKAEIAIKCVDDDKTKVILDQYTPQSNREFAFALMKDFCEQDKNCQNKEKQFYEFDKNDIAMKNKQLNLEHELVPTIIPHEPYQPDLIQDTEKVKTHKQINLETQLGPTYYETPLEIKPEIEQDSKPDNHSVGKLQREINLVLNLDPSHHNGSQNPDNIQTAAEQSAEKKITYADSLKSDQPLQRNKRSENIDLPGRWIKARVTKRNHKDEDVLLNLNSFSDDDIKKDDRYTGPKTKYEKKKHDRQRSHKRQKRHNKYEQWEMKGGYLKDFDEMSVTSSQDNLINKPAKKFLNTDFEKYLNMLKEADNNASNKDLPKTTKNVGEGSNKLDKRISKGERRRNVKAKEFEWYDLRAALRAEARIKLEQELFGENTSNTAAWYFRRMQKREQCRGQKDNSTFKKFSKRKMNFKMKR